MNMKERGNKNIIPVGGIVGVITLIVLILIGNILIIGDKIANINLLLSFLFYGVVCVLFVWLIIAPVLRVMMIPRLNGIRAKNITHLTPTETSEYILDLRKSITLTREEDRELRLGNNRKKTIENILNRCKGEMEQVIKQSAISNFAITAISQNGSLDFMSSIVINLRMINSIVGKLGKRPSYSQLFKLYFSVLSASLLVTTLDEIFDDVDFGELLGGIGTLGGQALNLVVPSAINGLMNAFVTLRVGYATVKYLEEGEKSFDKSAARIYAVKSARKHILSVGKEGVVEIARKTKQMASNIV